MDSLTYGALSGVHRPVHSASVRTHPCRQATSGDGLRSCLGIIRLASQYSTVRVEAAAERALLRGACRYQSVKSILKNALDQQPLGPPPMPPTPSSPHDNIRGAEYFE